MDSLSIALLCIHSSPLGALGTKNTGGMSIVVRETARQLGLRGHDVDIYTAAADGYREKVVSLGKNVRLIHLNESGRGHIAKSDMFSYLPQLYEALNVFREQQGIAYDLVHSHYWLSARLGCWAQADWKVPHVITYHTLGWLKNDLGPLENETDLRIQWECRLSKSCSRVLVATGKERADLVEQCKIDDSKVGIVPFGVDTEAFNIGNSHEARKNLGLDREAPLVLFVGRFVPLKGVERLIKAVSLMDKSENARLLLIGGDGPAAASTTMLKALSRQIGVGEKVKFIGRIAHSDLVDYYNAVDVLALPSYYESFGLVALESLACGTPVVATPVGVVESVVRNDENGLIVHDHTAGGIAKALSRVLKQIREDKVVPDAVRASVLKYAWPSVSEAMCNEYAGVINANQRRPGVNRV